MSTLPSASLEIRIEFAPSGQETPPNTRPLALPVKVFADHSVPVCLYKLSYVPHSVLIRNHSSNRTALFQLSSSSPIAAMKFVLALAAISVLSVASALRFGEVEHFQLPTLSRGKFKIKPATEKSKDGCPKASQIRLVNTFTITVGDFEKVLTVTRKCFQPKDARRVSRKEKNCVKKRVKRSCNPKASDERKEACIMVQVQSCAPFAVITMPTPEPSPMA